MKNYFAIVAFKNAPLDCGAGLCSGRSRVLCLKIGRCGGWIRTTDCLVMSQSRYHCATPRY